MTKSLARRSRLGLSDRLIQRYHGRRDARTLRRGRAEGEPPHLGWLTRGCDLEVSVVYSGLLQSVTTDRVRLAILRNDGGTPNEITTGEARIETMVRDAQGRAQHAIVLGALRIATYRRALLRRLPEVAPFTPLAERYLGTWVRAVDPWEAIQVAALPAPGSAEGVVALSAIGKGI